MFIYHAPLIRRVSRIARYLFVKLLLIVLSIDLKEINAEKVNIPTG